MSEETKQRSLPAEAYFDPYTTWRCTNCGEFHLASNGEWRWNGEIWEHKCPHLPPQAGHLPAEPIRIRELIGDLQQTITDLEANVAQVYLELTEGAFQKVNTDPAAVIAAAVRVRESMLEAETSQLSLRIATLERDSEELRKRRDALLVANNRLVEERRALVGLSTASCQVLAKEAYDTHQKAIRGYLQPKGWNHEQQKVWESVASAIVVAVRAQVVRQERERLIAELGGEG